MKVNIHNTEHYLWGDHCDGWLLVDEAERSIIYEQMPPHTKEIRHYHERARQFFFVLEGKAVMYIEKERIELNAHEGISVMTGIPHQMTNESGENVKFLVISQPATRGDRINCQAPAQSV